MRPADSERFARLIDWSTAHGASLHPCVEIYDDAATGFSLRARQDPGAQPESRAGLEPGQAVVSCPASTTLSYLNALNGGDPLDLDKPAPSPAPPAAFPGSFMKATPPYVVGRFFLMQQFLRGRQSHWSPYIETLPQPERIASWNLPPFWPEEDADLLDGTNAHVAMEEIRANVSWEFKRARRILKEVGYPGWQDYTRLLYNWAFCIFTSRSFTPSLVLSEEAKEKVLGSLLPEGCGLDDFSILLPLLDVANHAPTARAFWDAQSDPKCLRLRFPDGYAPGEQVFNNYGPKTNSELLLGYGFVLPETEEIHNDYVHLVKRTQAPTPTGTARPKPSAFLVSLRPMSHPSSLSGRAEQLPRRKDSPRREMLPEFGLFGDALLYDMCTTLWRPAEKERLEKETDAPPAEDEPFRKGMVVERVFDADPGSRFGDLVERVREILLDQLASAYQRLADTQVDGDDDDEAADLDQHPNRQLARLYRRQYIKVLRNAIQALDPSVELAPLT